MVIITNYINQTVMNKNEDEKEKFIEAFFDFLADIFEE